MRGRLFCRHEPQPGKDNTAVQAKKSARNVWAWGCGGCALVGLVLWSFIWFGIAHQLRQSEALKHIVTVKSGPVTLSQAVGGVARCITDDALTMIQEVTWTPDSRYLFYLASPELSFNKIIGVANTNNANPFDIHGNSERTQRQMLEMMAPRLWYFDLQSGVGGELQVSWPAGLNPDGQIQVSPDGRYLAMRLVNFSQRVTLDDSSPPLSGPPGHGLEGDLYVLPLQDGPKIGLPIHVAPASQFLWLADSRRLICLQEAGKQPGTYLANIIDGKAQLLDQRHTDYVLHGVSGDQNTAYCSFQTEERNLVGGRWSLQHLDLHTGKFRAVPLVKTAFGLGPLTKTEKVRLFPLDRDALYKIMAIDYATGRVRELHSGLKGSFWSVKPIFKGEALLMETDAGKGLESEKKSYAILSLNNGKLRLYPQPLLSTRPPAQWWVSPDGEWLALKSDNDKMIGLNPFSMLREKLWVVRLPRSQ